MATLPRLVIIGAGGFGREMWAWAEQSVQFEREWTLKGFIDDNLDALKGKPSPGALLGTIMDYQPAAEDAFICAIGVPEIKRRCSELIASRGGRFTRLFHRSAVLGHNVEMAEGVILCPYAVASANNRLGRGVALNLHATVDHDATVGDWTQINCHCDLTASVEVGREVFFGSRVSVIPNVKIGDKAYIGAGSVVLRDVAAGVKVVGVPARRIG
ncbi:MAG: NeuD/PglB/VioB family sugar acetyltransferase [Opitutae bacterium]|nr:NeuD/PglB/VioB family sugar acetyltransferase [Opitutae bacterium]